jgi:hypothetical protein
MMLRWQPKNNHPKLPINSQPHHMQKPSHFFQYRFFMLMVIGSIVTLKSVAQKDTTPQQITIITDYKPVIKSVAKMNLTGTNLSGDTTKVLLPYKVPVQNLNYLYQPVTLRSLSLEKESLIEKGDRLMVKGGFGTFRTPLLQAATYIGDGKVVLCNISTDYTSSKGRLENQDYSSFNVKSSGSYFLPSHEAYATLHYNRDQHYLYGYDSDRFKFTKSEVSQLKQTIGLAAGFRNTVENDFNIVYDPNIAFNITRLNDNLREINFKAQVPVEKRLNDKFFVRLNASGDFTRYTTLSLIPENITIKNDIFTITPEIHYHVNKLKIHGGVNYYNNNGSAYFLPNISAEFSLSKDNLIFQAGWIGDLQKNNFASLSTTNPYLRYLSDMKNTRQTEIYGGFKMSLIKHVLFTAKASYIRYQDYQLFINDTSSDQSMRQFLVVHQAALNNFRLHGDISYILRDKFDLRGGITINAFTGMPDGQKAWHTLPLELDAAMKWQLNKRILFKSHFYLFAGGHYLDRNNITRSLGGGADLSLGAEFRINSHFTAFTDLNNIFGRNYQRWHNYPVYGFNAILGVIARF